MKRWPILFLAALSFLAAFAPGETARAAGTYARITQDEAREMMRRDDGHILLDVRRQDEFDAGHIPGAVLLPNEEIGAERPDALPDLDQVILIYCRSGRRSKEAARKLADMGYTNIYEFGGILDWTGEIETAVPEEALAALAFPSFDGGGPEYSVAADDPDIVAWTSRREYKDPDHELLDGAGYDVIFTFIGLRPGTTAITVSERSPVAESGEARYAVTVDEALNVTLARMETELSPDISPQGSAEAVFTPKKSVIGSLLSAIFSGGRQKTVGAEIGPADITEFWYTYDNINYPAFYQRYRFYIEDGEYRFAYETRERDGYGPATEADTTASGVIGISEEEWRALQSLLREGTVEKRGGSAKTGDSGPWLFLYWNGDGGAWQQFTFAPGRLALFEAFCEELKAAGQ